MNTKEAGDKLQQGYHAMIDSIESLIKKEDMSLKQALEITEDKLEEWEDLTIDQYKHIRNEVRQDLYALGDKLDDAKTSFKHRLEMDTDYIKKSTAHKFSSIADKKIHELIEFKDSIFKNDEDLSSEENILAEHRDHTHWHDDYSFWMTEIAMWRKETHDAEAKLLAIHDATNKHDISLQDHVKNLHLYDKAIHDHEAKIASLEKPYEDDSEESNGDQLTHKNMSKSHKEYALLQQQLKNKHREMMILVERLYDLTHE